MIYLLNGLGFVYLLVVYFTFPFLPFLLCTALQFYGPHELPYKWTSTSLKFGLTNGIYIDVMAIYEPQFLIFMY